MPGIPNHIFAISTRLEIVENRLLQVWPALAKLQRKAVNKSQCTALRCTMHSGPCSGRVDSTPLPPTHKAGQSVT